MVDQVPVGLLAPDGMKFSRFHLKKKLDSNNWGDKKCNPTCRVRRSWKIMGIL